MDRYIALLPMLSTHVWVDFISEHMQIPLYTCKSTYARKIYDGDICICGRWKVNYKKCLLMSNNMFSGCIVNETNQTQR